MRLSKPRVAPTDPAGWSDEQKEIFKGVTERGPPLNIFRTLAHHPAAAKAYLRFANHVLSRANTIPARERGPWLTVGAHGTTKHCARAPFSQAGRRGPRSRRRPPTPSPSTLASRAPPLEPPRSRRWPRGRKIPPSRQA